METLEAMMVALLHAMLSLDMFVMELNQVSALHLALSVVMVKLMCLDNSVMMEEKPMVMDALQLVKLNLDTNAPTMYALNFQLTPVLQWKVTYSQIWEMSLFSLKLPNSTISQQKMK